MNYEIIIEDMHNLVEPLVLHYAERGSINQRWLGSDDKTQPLVGCELNYSLEVFGGEDAMYIEYFTSDEKRFRVTKKIEGTEDIVYRGFLLPESYDEPYRSQLFYVNFSAVDGIGLLRGKKMQDSFYEEEHYVTQVIADILAITQVNFDIYLAPAIRNHLKKKWHEIVIDGRKYIDKDKKESAYDILKSIVLDMRCQLFQSEGRWYVEGINFRHLNTVKFDKYDIGGNYVGSSDVNKNVKEVYWSPTPTISVIPGLKEVTVTHAASELTLSPELYKETAISWVNAAGVLGVFNPRHWVYDVYQPKVRYPEYYLELPAGQSSTVNPGNYIELREKPFILKGTKVRINIAFELIPQQFRGITSDEIAARRASAIWIDMQVFKVLLNETILFYNLNTEIGDPNRLVFDDNLKANATLEFVAQGNGYLNIQLMEPKGLFEDTLIGRVRLTNLQVEDIEQKDNFVYTETVNEESSQVREIELEHSDNIFIESKAFYLERVRDFEEDKGEYLSCPILHGRPQNGKNYSIVSVESAVLIEQFPNFLFYNTWMNPIPAPRVIYNLNGGEEMAIETGDTLYDSGTFYVRAKPYKPASINRTEWLKWSDAVYEVEQKPYAQVVAEIEGKLFKNPHLRIAATAQAPIKFNDLIHFKYNNNHKFFVPSSVDWNSSENEATGIFNEGVYAGNSLGQIPPYVEAGPDLYLSPGETSVQITEAVATAPSGYIDSIQWQKLNGDAGESYSTPTALNPLISGLTGDSYEFQLTAVASPSGLSGSDTMRVLRRGEYEVLYELLDTYTATAQNGQIRKDSFRVYLSPDLPASITVNLNFKILFELYLVSSQDSGYGYLKINKNGNDLYSKAFTGDANGTLSREETSLISFNSTDTIELYFEARVEIDSFESAAQSLVRLVWTEASFVNGIGAITNLPAVKEISADI